MGHVWMEADYGNHVLTIWRSGPIIKSLPNQPCIQHRLSALSRNSRYWNGNEIIHWHSVPRMLALRYYIYQFFLDRIHECICLCHYNFYEYLRSLAIHMASQHAWPSLHSTTICAFATSVIGYTYFMTQWCATEVKKGDCALLWSLLGASFQTGFMELRHAPTA